MFKKFRVVLLRFANWSVSHSIARICENMLVCGIIWDCDASLRYDMIACLVFSVGVRRVAISMEDEM